MSRELLTVAVAPVVANSNGNHTYITPKELADRWRISVDTVYRLVKCESLRDIRVIRISNVLTGGPAHVPTKRETTLLIDAILQEQEAAKREAAQSTTLTTGETGASTEYALGLEIPADLEVVAQERQARTEWAMGLELPNPPKPQASPRKDRL